jgi:putative ABC transport system permease protein
VSGGCNVSYFRRPDAASGDAPAGIHWATTDFFPALGIQLQHGRTFTDRDRAGQSRVAVINDAAARTFFPGEDPIGKTIAVGQARGFSQGAEVIGVVANVRYGTIDTAAKPDVYVPLMQAPQSSMRLFVRARTDATSLAGAIRREVAALDATLPLSEIKTMNERVGDAMWRTRIGAWLLSTFAAVALLLTAIGVFGIMAQTVVQRTAEIGIRMALGAERRDVLALVLRRAVVVTAAGVTLGLASAIGLTRVLATLLYEVTPTDPLTFVSVAVVITVVALAACYVPARRATHVDAIVALRTE